MLVTFAVPLKHRLRFEPFTHYEDMRTGTRHLPILAQEAESRYLKGPSTWKLIGLVLKLPMVESNPRKLIKNPTKPLGNVPLEILSFCSAYIKTIIDNGTLKATAYHAQAMIEDYIHREENMPLYPLNNQGFHSLKTKSPQEIREMIKARVELPFGGSRQQLK
jgi:hypothetical protein